MKRSQDLRTAVFKEETLKHDPACLIKQYEDLGNGKRRGERVDEHESPSDHTWQNPGLSLLFDKKLFTPLLKHLKAHSNI